ncbi:DUF1707 domain-containing protein [Actinophytocola sp.]|uniref:DUF1707 SHOCT-like domain-containing protein n=1 Tax=Actinophytocola sp. TaxID=1872138 RepID=UPI00389A073B
MSETSTRPSVRCSDAERERTCATLHKAAGEGRLSLTEVEERIAKVYEARYRHELADLAADLPVETGPATGWRAVGVVVWRQLAVEAAVLLGRAGEPHPRRRVVLAAVLAVVFVSMLVMAFHGVADDGFGHHGLGHD